eukprot:3771197-Pleurochrysis_carterae.AAC.1
MKLAPFSMFIWFDIHRFSGVLGSYGYQYPSALSLVLQLPARWLPQGSSRCMESARSSCHLRS